MFRPGLHGHTFRHEQYPEYKAGRDKQPEDITVAIPYIKKILQAYRIPVVEVEGYEADDVIGTLSRMAEAEGFITYMMTPDKDYGQLVTDRVFMYRPAIKGQGFEIRGPSRYASATASRRHGRLLTCSRSKAMPPTMCPAAPAWARKQP